MKVYKLIGADTEHIYATATLKETLNKLLQHAYPSKDTGLGGGKGGATKASLVRQLPEPMRILKVDTE